MCFSSWLWLQFRCHRQQSFPSSTRSCGPLEKLLNEQLNVNRTCILGCLAWSLGVTSVCRPPPMRQFQLRVLNTRRHLPGSRSEMVAEKCISPFMTLLFLKHRCHCLTPFLLWLTFHLRLSPHLFQRFLAIQTVSADRLVVKAPLPLPSRRL